MALSDAIAGMQQFYDRSFMMYIQGLKREGTHTFSRSM